MCSDFGAQENKVCHYFHCFPIYLPWCDGTRSHDLSFWMLSFKPAFSLSSFTFITRLFSSSLLSAIRVVSSAYLRLLIFLPAILIPAYNSSSLTIHMMYSAYKLNKLVEGVLVLRGKSNSNNMVDLLLFPVIFSGSFLNKCRLPFWTGQDPSNWLIPHKAWEKKIMYQMLQL